MGKTDGQCAATLKSGKRCSRKAVIGNLCKQHHEAEYHGLGSVNPTALVAQVTDRDLAARVPQVPIGDMLMQAIRSKLDDVSIERLVELRREMKAEWALEQFNAALAKFQSECPVIVKTNEIPDKQGNVRSMYAPLQVIVHEVAPILERNGLSYTLDTKQPESLDSVTAFLTVRHVAGHAEISTFTIPVDPGMVANNPQRVVAANTYAKRIVFCNGLGIMTADPDDDGQALGEATDGTQQKPKRKRKAKGKKEETFESVETLAEKVADLVKRPPYAENQQLAYKMKQNAERMKLQGNTVALKAVVESMERLVKQHAKQEA